MALQIALFIWTLLFVQIASHTPYLEEYEKLIQRPFFEDGSMLQENIEIPRNPSLYRLPTTTIPETYTVVFTIDPYNQASFSGEVDIDVIAMTNTEKIVLHANNLVINSVSVKKLSDDSEIYSQHILSSNDTHFFEIYLSEETIADQHYLVHIEYDGQYGDSSEGLFLNTYFDEHENLKYYVATQFQPVSARKAFPCYDEPALKAVFHIRIYCPPDFEALSLMDVIESDLSDKPGYSLTSFGPTPKMSTYILAVVVSDFDHISNIEDGPQHHAAKFRVYGRSNINHTFDYALDFSQKSIIDLEDYYGINFRLDKLDNVGIPDSRFGAMENWGLVIYREQLLFFNEEIMTTKQKENIALIISHENAHMWFGNEVSPAWWDYLWLNEGFATYFESFSTDSVYNGEWKLMESFIPLYVQSAMRSDAMPIVSSMTSTVGSPSQILAKFSFVVYKKAASVLRMFRHIMGEEVFRQALFNYLQSLLLGITEPSKLYSAMEQAAAGQNLFPFLTSVEEVFSTWADQAGFPLIMVIGDGSKRSIHISQHRYYANSAISSNEKWWVPLTWATESNPSFDTTTTQAWLRPVANLSLTFDQEEEWFIFNRQHMGYYRVMYDLDNWMSLGRALMADNFSGIHLLNRAQLINDAFEFARTERLSYNISFEILNYMSEETDYTVWLSANAGIQLLGYSMPASKNYDLYIEFMLNLNKKSYELVGFESVEDEEHMLRLYRPFALNLACNTGSLDCRQKANEKFIELRESGAKINTDLRSFYYCSGLRLADQNLFDSVWDEYLATSSQTERSFVINSLGCAEIEQVSLRYLGFSISDDVNIFDTDRHIVIEAVINSGKIGVDRAVHFVRENFPIIQQKVTSTVRIINALGNRIVTDEQIDIFKLFMEEHDAIFTTTERYAARIALTMAESDRSRIDEILLDIDPWLEINVRSENF